LTISLRESQAITKLATYLYDFLPGSPHPYADQTISFRGAATAAGLSEFWQGGSKLPAINRLLTETLERRRERFCKLIVEIVRRSILYRQNKASGVTRATVEHLNELVAGVGFKIPELYDPAFLVILPGTSRRDEKSEHSVSGKQTTILQQKFIALTQLPPNLRGQKFEPFLTELFDLYALEARGSIHLVGEQIDGSFQLEGQTYLLEAKWQNESIGVSELHEFHSRVTGKTTWGRGAFISISGFTKVGLDAYNRGRGTAIICIDGLDLAQVLQGRLDLREVLRRKARRAVETNEAFVPVRELFSGVI